MENVVYFLGAGFSAPLDLPVMSNFLEKSKDLYSSDPEGYSYFTKVFDKINELSITKNYFEADLFNIEEILSVLEMQSYLSNSKYSSLFKKYIIDVINYYTPEIEGDALKKSIISLKKDVKSDLLKYGFFVSSLIGLVIEKVQSDFFISNTSTKRDANYSVITLNYDTVIEDFMALLDSRHLISTSLNNVVDFKIGHHLSFAKLHGSIDSKEIVPPTWKKGGNKNVLNAWKLAYKLLSNANHIRIIGYSLPVTDAYIRYLLKSSVINNQNLKSIDIICLDPKGEVKKIYDDFITFYKYNFFNTSVTNYFGFISLSDISGGIGKRYAFNRLEESHKQFKKNNP